MPGYKMVKTGKGYEALSISVGEVFGFFVAVKFYKIFIYFRL
ncbi:hypothetical protein [Candidatus Campylobacter infans]|nr:hypothetical protein [Candidatus Campylobacter infans]